MRRRTAAAAALGLLAMTACSSSTSQPTTGSTSGGTSPESARHCPVSAQLVPACGVLWGIATRPQTLSVVRGVEHQVGRRFDVVYQYHDIDDTIPTPDERAEVRRGQILHLAIAARIYGQNPDQVTYADIAAGRYDADLTRQAQGLASLGVPVFVTFEQEANQHDKVGARGTPADFRAAWRHVHDVYEAAGATNVVWVWVMTGSPDNLTRAGELWPGNDVVDWISWNVYNQSGCGGGAIKPNLEQTFRQALQPFYDWVHTKGPALGIDPGKPMMISETGSVLYADDPARTAAWYSAIPQTLADYPQVKAIALWDSSTSELCDYRFQRSPVVLHSVTEAGNDPVVTGLGPR